MLNPLTSESVIKWEEFLEGHRFMVFTVVSGDRSLNVCGYLGLGTVASCSTLNLFESQLPCLENETQTVFLYFRGFV